MVKSWMSVLVGTAMMVLVGCADQPSSTTKGKNESTPVASAKRVHDHSGWWCDEHGIPEEECSMCSTKVAKALMAKGDWCKEHNRAKSQCFVCDPSLQARFAAKYEAKYGKKPPEPEGQKE